MVPIQIDFWEKRVAFKTFFNFGEIDFVTKIGCDEFIVNWRTSNDPTGFNIIFPFDFVQSFLKWILVLYYRSKGVAVEDTHGWDNTHRFKHTLFQYTCFQTYTIQIYIDSIIHYFSITGIWVYSIKIYKYPNIKMFRYMAVCIQTQI